MHHVMNTWEQNNYSLRDIPCVYVIISLDYPPLKNADIVYVGSTLKLKSRYRCHKIPDKIQMDKKANLLFYLPMKTGFYDYEIKLIRKLLPKYNKNYKTNG